MTESVGAPPLPDPPPAQNRTRAVDNPRGAFIAVYRLLVRSLATRGRLISLGLLGLVGVTVGIALGASHPFDPLDSGTHFVDALGSTKIADLTTGDIGGIGCS